METIKTTIESANNVDYQPEWVDIKSEISDVKELVIASINRKKEVLWETLNDEPLNMSEFAEEQQVATDLSRLFWKEWSMLGEQLANLGLNYENLKEKAVNNINKWVWSILLGQAA